MTKYFNKKCGIDLRKFKRFRIFYTIRSAKIWLDKKGLYNISIGFFFVNGLDIFLKIPIYNLHLFYHFSIMKLAIIILLLMVYNMSVIVSKERRTDNVWKASACVQNTWMNMVAPQLSFASPTCGSKCMFGYPR